MKRTGVDPDPNRHVATSASPRQVESSFCNLSVSCYFCNLGHYSMFPAHKAFSCLRPAVETRAIACGHSILLAVSSMTRVHNVTALTHASGNNLTTVCSRCLSQRSWRRSRHSWLLHSSLQVISRPKLPSGAIVAAASRSRAPATPRRPASHPQQGPAMSSCAAIQLVEEETLRDAARNALRESGLYIKEEWVSSCGLWGS